MDLDQNIDTTPTEKSEAPKFVHPADLYSKMFNDILSGLLIALKFHNGDIKKVTLEAIAEYSLVEAGTIKHYYKNVKAITDEVDYALSSLISAAEQKIFGLSSGEIFMTLLQSVQGDPLMIDVIIQTEGARFWKKHIKAFVRKATESWGIDDETLWLEVYDVFCYQFQSAMRKWSENVYSDESLPLIVSRIEAWLDADEEFIINIMENFSAEE
jgi:hypothetical protein